MINFVSELIVEFMQYYSGRLFQFYTVYSPKKFFSEQFYIENVCKLNVCQLSTFFLIFSPLTVKRFENVKNRFKLLKII